MTPRDKGDLNKAKIVDTLDRCRGTWLNAADINDITGINLCSVRTHLYNLVQSGQCVETKYYRYSGKRKTPCLVSFFQLRSPL